MFPNPNLGIAAGLIIPDIVNSRYKEPLNKSLIIPTNKSWKMLISNYASTPASICRKTLCQTHAKQIHTNYRIILNTVKNESQKGKFNDERKS